MTIAIPPTCPASLLILRCRCCIPDSTSAPVWRYLTSRIFRLHCLPCEPWVRPCEVPWFFDLWVPSLLRLINPQLLSPRRTWRLEYSGQLRYRLEPSRSLERRGERTGEPAAPPGVARKIASGA